MYKYPGYNYFFFNEVDSTQNIARKLIQDGFHDLNIIYTDMQLNGYGRKKDRWISEENDIAFTFSIEFALIHRNFLIYIVAIAIRNVLFQIGCNDIFLKWPNDIILNDEKIGGILIEDFCYKNKNFALIGIGLNGFKKDNTYFKSSSLENDFINLDNKKSFISSIVDNYLEIFDLYIKNGFNFVRSIYLEYTYKLGELAKIEEFDGNFFEGSYCGINKNGFLIIKKKNGEIVELIDCRKIRFK